MEDILSEIHDTGYGVTKVTVDLPVMGMTCANCVAAVERTLQKKVLGVVQATANFATEKAHVEYVPALCNIDDMIAAVKAAGYEAFRPDGASGAEDAELAARKAETANQTRKALSSDVFPTSVGVDREPGP